MKPDNQTPVSPPANISRYHLQLAGRVWPGLILALLCPGGVLAQPFALSEYLPYASGATSTLTSAVGFTLEVTGDSATDFHWHATSPVLEGLREDYRLNASGLSLRFEYGTAPGSGAVIYTQTYNPAWQVSPATVTNGQVIVSAANYAGTEPGDNWTGNADGSLTIGPVESVVTPAGTFSALKAIFISTWAETGVGYTTSGITTQIWWMAKSVGVVQFDYGYEETYLESGGTPETESEQVVFTLATNSLFVVFPDPKLTAAVRVALGKPTGGISRADLAGLTSLAANQQGITNLSGLEFAVNLTSLNLTLNAITDLTPLAGLTNLFELDAGGNQIQNLQPLSQMKALFALQLFNNQISDLSPLANLIKVANLSINQNQITDLSPLSTMPGLGSLVANDNQISDLSPLGGLSKLISVEAARNHIANAAPLSSLTGLLVIRLQDNLLTDLTPLSTLTKLTSATVSQNFLDITPGADDRQIIDDWIGRGALVTFSPQHIQPAVSVSLIGGDTLRLAWDSALGLTYQLQYAADALNWLNATNPPLSGTGSPLALDVALGSEPAQNFRLLIARE